VIKQTFIDTQM